jgi:hypothetical protein
LVQVFHVAGRNAVTDANVVGYGALFKVATQNGTVFLKLTANLIMKRVDIERATDSEKA